jgi:hypothetical protein
MSNFVEISPAVLRVSTQVRIEMGHHTDGLKNGHTWSFLCKLFSYTMRPGRMRRFKGPIHDQSCCATLRVVQLVDRVWCWLTWSWMGKLVLCKTILRNMIDLVWAPLNEEPHILRNSKYLCIMRFWTGLSKCTDYMLATVSFWFIKLPKKNILCAFISNLCDVRRHS